MAAFTLGVTSPFETKITTLTEDIDTIFFSIDDNCQLLVLHSPKNLGGTHMQATHKILLMMGLGQRATGVILDHFSALAAMK